MIFASEAIIYVYSRVLPITAKETIHQKAGDTTVHITKNRQISYRSYTCKNK